MGGSMYVHPFRVEELEFINDSYFLLTARSLWSSLLYSEPGKYIMLDAVIGEEYYRRSYSAALHINQIKCLIHSRDSFIFANHLRKQTLGTIIRGVLPVGKEKYFPVNQLQKCIFFCFGSGISFPFSLTTFTEGRLPGVSIFWFDPNSDMLESQKVSLRIFPDSKVILLRDKEELVLSIINSISSHHLFYLSGDNIYIQFVKFILQKYGIKDSQIIQEIYYHHKETYPQDWVESL